MEQDELDELQKLINKYFLNKKITTIPPQKKGNKKSNYMQERTVVTSGFGKLNVRDLLQGAVMAGLGAGAGLLYPVLDAWATGAEVVLNLPLIWKAAVAAGILHIVRKLMHPPVVVITNPPQQMVNAVKSGEVLEVTTPESASKVMELDSGNQKSSI